MLRSSSSLVAIVVLVAFTSSVSAQTIRESVAAIGARSAAQPDEDDDDDSGAGKGLLWTGVGLMGGGGLSLLLGNVIKNSCDDNFARREFRDQECHDLTLGSYVLGGILLGTGVTLFAIGNAKRKRVSPQVRFGPTRMTLGAAVRF